MKALNRLNSKTLESRPIRVLQFGGGNFLRGFFDWMVDVLNENTSFNGDVVLIKPTSGGNYQELIDQEGLFHTILQDHSGEVTRLIDCIQNVIHPYMEWQSFLNTASLPACRYVVSNTTESGITYQYEPLNLGQPQNSFPAKLAVWLFERFKTFNGDHSKGVIVLPTELIEKNGQKLREAVLSHAVDWELNSDFISWIETSNNFCNTLVDRIVSGFPAKAATKIQHSLGFNDTQLVVGENYHQWVIESTWSILDEIPFEQTNLNVSLVENLRPYREIKVRILNGAHTALVPIGMLSGLFTVCEVMKDQNLGTFVQDLIELEIVPTFSGSTIDAASFAKNTILRFENPYINHQLKSISLNAFQKFQVRLIPSIILYLERFKTYPARIMFCWAALIYEEAGDPLNLGFLDDWDLMGLNKDDVIDELRVNLKSIHQLGISKSIKVRCS